MRRVKEKLVRAEGKCRASMVPGDETRFGWWWTGGGVGGGYGGGGVEGGVRGREYRRKMIWVKKKRSDVTLWLEDTVVVVDVIVLVIAVVLVVTVVIIVVHSASGKCPISIYGKIRSKEWGENKENPFYDYIVK